MKCEEALTTPSTDMHPHDPDDVLPTCEQAATYRLTSGTVGSPLSPSSQRGATA